MTHRLRVVLEHFPRFFIVADFFNALALEIPALHLLKKARVRALGTLQDRAGAIFIKKHWKQREAEVVWSANHALTSHATLADTPVRTRERFNSRRVLFGLLSYRRRIRETPGHRETRQCSCSSSFLRIHWAARSGAKVWLHRAAVRPFTRFNQIVNN